MHDIKERAKIRTTCDVVEYESVNTSVVITRSEDMQDNGAFVLRHIKDDGWHREHWCIVVCIQHFHLHCDSVIQSRRANGLHKHCNMKHCNTALTVTVRML